MTPSKALNDKTATAYAADPDRAITTALVQGRQEIRPRRRAVHLRALRPDDATGRGYAPVVDRSLSRLYRKAVKSVRPQTLV